MKVTLPRGSGVLDFSRVDDCRTIQLIPLIKSYTEIKNKKILDFGCGAGSSTFALALEGGIVTGVDIASPSIYHAKKNKVKYYKQCRVDFTHINDTTSLPFPNECFNIVVCNAVFEHILPQERELILKEIFRIVKLGGFIVITGTPNRNFPKDGHTSELMFVPWMPLWLAKYYVVFRNGGIKKTDPIATMNLSVRNKLKKIPDDEWLYRGIRSMSYHDIKRWSKKNGLTLKCLNNDNRKELERYFLTSTSWKDSKILYFLIIIFVLTINLFNISIHNFLPYLNSVFKKMGKVGNNYYY
ncbi:MAG: class I SAM-dependent methyltransferase [Candidatus Cloacimonetes bacterium]|nr:class I SAM-dependent methyltransferase [Candidatus Cloacimonadota bacterium]